MNSIENITPKKIRELYTEQLSSSAGFTTEIADMVENIATYILEGNNLALKKIKWQKYWLWFAENTDLIKIRYFLSSDDYPDVELDISKEYYTDFSDAVMADTLDAPSDFFEIPNITSGDWDVWDWEANFYVTSNKELLKKNLFYRKYAKKQMLKAFTEQLEDKYRDAPLTHEIFSEDTIALHLWMKDLHTPLSVRTPEGFVMYRSIATNKVITYLFKYQYSL
jgi:IS1 family transposase